VTPQGDLRDPPLAALPWAEGKLPEDDAWVVALRPTSIVESVRQRLGGSPAGEETRSRRTSRRPAGTRRHGASRAVAGERLISRCEAHALGHGTRVTSSTPGSSRVNTSSS